MALDCGRGLWDHNLILSGHHSEKADNPTEKPFDSARHDAPSIDRKETILR
jgi:hypothetical protein